MDEHKTPEEIINDNAAPDAPETDAPEACAQPEEVTAGEPAAGEADPAEVPAPAETKPMSVRARHAFRRGVAGLLAAIVLLAVSGFGVFRIARGAQGMACRCQTAAFDADPAAIARACLHAAFYPQSRHDPGTFVQHDIVFILNTFSDPNGGSAQYGVVPIGGKLVAFRFPARWNASVKTIADATTSVLSGQSYSVDSFIRVTGTVKTMPEAVSSALYDWYTENNAYLQQIGAIGDSDDAADYLPDAIVCVDTVGSIPQGWVEGLTVAAVACLIYAIVVLIRILCGKYEQEKLPDITFELVDMTPETEAECCAGGRTCTGDRRRPRRAARKIRRNRGHARCLTTNCACRACSGSRARSATSCAIWVCATSCPKTAACAAPARTRISRA